MSLWSRILLLLKVKGAAAVDRAEDPRETLNYADEQQQEPPHHGQFLVSTAGIGASRPARVATPTGVS